MLNSLKKMNIIFKILNSSLYILPTPVNISIWWNWGSMLGICLMIQIISGFFLSTHYTPHIDHAFNSVIHIMNNVNNGWMMRLIHMNGASIYFFCMYMHLARNLYYHSFFFISTWMIGVTILLLSMATAFMGYVLPWGQMSFWGATVITNLLSAIPYIGQMIVLWLWGGFSINNATLNRFYSIHFIMPLIILLLVVIHISYLHNTGSSNPMGLNSNLYKIPFYKYFIIKDSMGFLILFMIFFFIILQYPYMLGDPDNFSPANSMITPIHIQPEWYFLFAYAILRSIPSKLGGVIALFMSILIFYFLPFLKKFKMKSSKFYPLNQIMFWLFLSSSILLTWTGKSPVEYPYIQICQINTIIYFSMLILFSFMNNFWDKIIYKQK